jgi:hypothetical protein
MMFRSGAFRRSKFQLSEHLEGHEDFAGRVLEKTIPQMGSATPEARHEDIGVDETGHLRLGIMRGDRGGKRTGGSNERRVIDGAESRHPLSGVSDCRGSIRLGGEMIELLRRPDGQRFAVACGKGIKPTLQAIIKMDD